MTENKPIERKLLYQTVEFCVGEDGMLCNPHNKPLRNIIYEIAKEFARKTQECERLKNERTVDLVKQLDQLKVSKEQTEQKLEKIRQVAESCIKGDVAKIRMEQILQIIDEVQDV